MPEKIGIVVVTHGHFGRELLQTAEDIVGRQDAALAISVTSETGVDWLCRAVEDAYVRLKSSEGVLYLVDMLGGTPCNTSLLKTKNLNAEVVTGVNLYMLISALTHRGHLDLRSLAAKAAEDGQRAIALAKDLLLKRAVS